MHSALFRICRISYHLAKMAGKSLRFVDGSQVEKSMDHRKLISSLEQGFQNFSTRSGVVQPVRTAVEVKEHNG